MEVKMQGTEMQWREDLAEEVKGKRPIRVMLAEDDADLRRLLACILRKDGYEVIEVKDGTELVDQMASSLLDVGSLEPIDLLISDIRMSGWTGLQVLASIRDTDWAFPVILITGYRDSIALTEASRLGATAGFLKPFAINDLRTAVLNYLPSSPADSVFGTHWPVH